MNAPPDLQELAKSKGSYTVEASADANTAGKILAWLPSDSYIEFFDATEPTGCLDPGTHFSMRRKGNFWQITGGNYGRTLGVAEITKEDAERFFAKCLQSNQGPWPACITIHRDVSELHWQSKWTPDSVLKRVVKTLNNDV